MSSKNDMLDKSPSYVYDYARRADPGRLEQEHVWQRFRAPLNRKSPDQIEQKI